MMLRKTEFLDQNNNIRKVVEIVLNNGISPGFGHSMLSIASMVAYSALFHHYPVLNDTNWGYGRWTDYFMPFWDEEEKASTLTQNLERFTIHVDHLQPLFFGFEPLVYESVQKMYRQIYRKIYSPRMDIIEASSRFANIDLAIHVRHGDHKVANPLADQIYKTERFIQKHRPKKIFVMTDERQVVNEFCKCFSGEVVSLCPDHYDGNPDRVRGVDNLKLLINEVEIAKSAQYFIGSPYSSVSNIVDICRDGKNVFYTSTVIELG